jgi:predicted RNase H-like HicB family nuclease
MLSYIAVIDKNYTISYPDFPSLTATGLSMSDARTKAAEVLADHIDQLLADGGKLPQPSRLEVVVADPAYQSGVAVMIESTP